MYSGFQFNELADDKENCEVWVGSTSGGACGTGNQLFRDLTGISFAGFAIIFFWEKIDAGKEVKKYNRRLYKSIYNQEPPSFSLNLQPTYQGATLTISYAFN